MTVPEFINEVLGAIQRQLYTENPKHFFRDRTGLMKAIARYGYECERRGWAFDVPFMLSEVMRILEVCKRQAQIEYLPTYLSSAIDQHIREHAEELNAKAKALRTVAAKELRTLRIAPETVREATPTETLALLYQDLARQRRAAKKPKAKPVQKELL